MLYRSLRAWNFSDVAVIRKMENILKNFKKTLDNLINMQYTIIVPRETNHRGPRAGRRKEKPP